MATYGCSFELLPLEMIFGIFDYLTIMEKKKARLVCQFWSMIVDHHKSVKFRPKLTNNKSIRHFLNSHQQMDSTVMRNVNSRSTRNNDSQNVYPRMTNAELGWKNSEGNIERFLLRGCEYVESLTLAKFSLEKIRRGAISKVLSEINWKNLTTFKVTVTMTKYKDTRAKKHLDNVTTLFKLARIPTIQEFEFDFDFRYGFAKKYKLRFQNLFLGLYPFLAIHSKSLKILTGRINTASDNTVEIPEIPTDLLETLSSSMKLRSCSLSLRGVRRLESIINPALFGSELRSLDLKALPCVRVLLGARRTRWRWDHFNRNTLDNIRVIFDRNGKSLTTVSLDMYLVPLACLQNLYVLECLKFEGFFQIEDPDDLKSLSHIRLKSFSARIHSVFSHTDFTPGLLQLLRQCVGTVEHLTLSRAHHNSMGQGRPIQFRIRDCTSLKSLKVDHISPEYIQQNLGGQYHHLRILETVLTGENEGQIVDWILESMRNLEYISILAPDVDISLLSGLLTLPKVKNICWSVKYQWLGFNIDLDKMHTFCKSIPGVTFNFVKQGRGIRHRGELYIISVNRPRTTVVNPINNYLQT